MLSIVIDCYHLFCMVIDGCGCLSNVIHNYGWLLTVIRGYVVIGYVWLLMVIECYSWLCILIGYVWLLMVMDAS